VFGCLALGYGWLVSMGWLHTGAVHASFLTGAALLGLAWLAGLLAQGWVLAQAWVVLAMAAGVLASLFAL